MIFDLAEVISRLNMDGKRGCVHNRPFPDLHAVVPDLADDVKIHVGRQRLGRRVDQELFAFRLVLVHLRIQILQQGLQSLDLQVKVNLNLVRELLELPINALLEPVIRVQIDQEEGQQAAEGQQRNRDQDDIAPAQAVAGPQFPELQQRPARRYHDEDEEKYQHEGVRDR